MKKILKHWQNILLMSMLITLGVLQILLWIDMGLNNTVIEKLTLEERQANLYFAWVSLVVIFLLKVLCEPKN